MTLCFTLFFSDVLIEGYVNLPGGQVCCDCGIVCMCLMVCVFDICGVHLFFLCVLCFVRE